MQPFFYKGMQGTVDEKERERVKYTERKRKAP
jgi:hypothetical protein